MTKAISLSQHEWRILREKLEEEYSPSVFMIRSKMKRVLGFVDRKHLILEDQKDKHGNDITRAYYSVRLDFYSEKKYTWFLLKYSDFINELENV